MGVTKQLLAHPNSAGLPDAVSLLPTTCGSLGWRWGMGQRGRGPTADTGALHSHREDTVLGRMCPQRTICLPSALSLGTRRWKGGGRAARRHTSRGHRPRPPQTEGWQLGENGGTFSPVGWVPVMRLPSLPRGPCTGRVPVTLSCPSAHSQTRKLPFPAENCLGRVSGPRGHIPAPKQSRDRIQEAGEPGRGK